jgi:hypothetical protein
VPQQAGLAPDSALDQSMDNPSVQQPITPPAESAFTEEQVQQALAREQLQQKQKTMFIKKSHVRRQPIDGLTESSRNIAECSLVPSEFVKLQQLSGRTFDFDAFSDEQGKNAHCKAFASKASTFMNADVTHKHVWMFPPPDQGMAKSAIDHMVDCWRKSPSTTSACIMLPKGFAHLTSGSQGKLRLVYTYAKGARIWKCPSTTGDKLIGTTCVMNVYMLDPLSPDMLSHSIQYLATHPNQTTPHHIDLLQEINPTPLAFRFRGSCRPIGIKRQPATPLVWADILQDGGASVEFVDLGWATRQGFKIKPTHTNWTVTVANQETVSVMGTVDLQIDIQGYTDNIKFLVIPMAFDMILGNRWARSRNIIVDYGKVETRVFHKGTEYTLTPYHVHMFPRIGYWITQQNQFHRTLRQIPVPQ